MKIIILISVVLISLPLFSCTNTNPQYLAQPESIQVTGTYTHVSSGIMFPQTVGNFHRNDVIRFDTQGLDVGASYADPTRPIAIDVYVYPAPSLVNIGSSPEVVESARSLLFQREFANQKQVILEYHDGAKLIEEADFSLS